MQYFHAPLRDRGHSDCRAVKGNLAPKLSYCRVSPSVRRGRKAPRCHPDPGGVAAPGPIEYGLVTAPFDHPRAARGTAELNLTYGTATAEAPAGKVVWGPGHRAAISGKYSKSTPPTGGEGLLRGSQTPNVVQNGLPGREGERHSGAGGGASSRHSQPEQDILEGGSAGSTLSALGVPVPRLLVQQP